MNSFNNHKFLFQESLRDGPAWSVVHPVQVEEGLHPLRRDRCTNVITCHARKRRQQRGVCTQPHPYLITCGSRVTRGTDGTHIGPVKLAYSAKSQHSTLSLSSATDGSSSMFKSQVNGRGKTKALFENPSFWKKNFKMAPLRIFVWKAVQLRAAKYFTKSKSFLKDQISSLPSQACSASIDPPPLFLLSQSITNPTRYSFQQNSHI